jgi:hypothetical protein
VKSLTEYLIEAEMSNNRRLIDNIRHNSVIEVHKLYDTVFNESNGFKNPVGMLYNQNFIYETLILLEEYYLTLINTFSKNDIIIIAIKELLDYFNS